MLALHTRHCGACRVSLPLDMDLAAEWLGPGDVNLIGCLLADGKLDAARQLYRKCQDEYRLSSNGTDDVGVSDRPTTSNGQGPELPQPVDWHYLFAREVDGRGAGGVDHLWLPRRAISVVPHATSPASRSSCLRRRLPGARCSIRRLGATRTTHHRWLLGHGDDRGRRTRTRRRLRPPARPTSTRFKYYLLPSIPPLDTPEGGKAVLDTPLRRDGVQATVFDTFGQVVEGRREPRPTPSPPTTAGVPST